MTDKATTLQHRLGRRDLIKMGVGTGASLALGLSPIAGAQEAAAAKSGAAKSDATKPDGAKAKMSESGPGFKNTANRISGNGPMDATTRQLVDYVIGFRDSDLTPELIDRTNNTMIDSIASIISGFETEPARITARMARTMQGSMKSTVFGYGIVTSPEYAAYANTCMGRYADFNDHASDMLPGIFAVGEAMHATGRQVMIASVLAYQINQALGAAVPPSHRRDWDQGLSAGPATALAVGKLMGLDADHLANALSLSLVPNIPLRVTRSGVLSMSKGCATAPAVRAAVFSCMVAREGMTGPCQPFEGRDGLFDKVTGQFLEMKLPPPKVSGLGLAADIKRNPSEGWTQTMLAVSIPKVKAWTTIDEIASIHIELAAEGWREIADPPKWDPQNHETADHSVAYDVARTLIDGEIYLDSFTLPKIHDPIARGLMEKTTVSANPAYHYHGQSRLTVRKRSGEELVCETDNPTGEFNFGTPMTHEEIVTKFKRICDFVHVNTAQANRALQQWGNLQDVRDIAEPIRNLATYGKPAPLA